MLATMSAMPNRPSPLRRLALLAAVVLSLAACSRAAPDMAAQPVHTKRIALTFDDIPRAPGAFMTPDERTRRIIAGLRAAGVKQAAFFLNPGMLSEPQGQGGEARIAVYVAAGHVIANHSFSHPRLNATPAADYLADIDRAETWLKGRNGRRAWFRFPFLDEGQGDKAKRDAVRAGLAQRGLTNGYVTVDASDWNMEQLAIDAKAAGERIDMDGLRRLYVASHVESANAADALAVRALARSPAHVMLLHETDLAALFLPDLVRALEKDGWRVVSADEAYADPIAPLAGTVDVPSAQGTLIEAIAWSRGLPEPRWWPGNQPEIARRRFAREVLGEEVK